MQSGLVLPAAMAALCVLSCTAGHIPDEATPPDSAPASRAAEAVPRPTPERVIDDGHVGGPVPNYQPKIALPDARQDFPLPSDAAAIITVSRDAATTSDAATPAPVMVDVGPPGKGCGKPSSFAPGKRTSVPFLIQGKDRKADVVYPKDYVPTRRYPILFFFHEAGVGTYNHKSIEFTSTAATEKISVFPAALGGTWMGHNADDLPFFDGILAWLDANACMDKTRVFATGLSSGAFFAGTLGCQRGDVLRAIAPAAGGLRDIVNCRGGNVAGMFMHGTLDAGRLPGMQQLRDYYLKRNGCDATKTEPAGAPYPAFCVKYAGCPALAPTMWCLDPDANHRWSEYAFEASWKFFMSLPPRP